MDTTVLSDAGEEPPVRPTHIRLSVMTPFENDAMFEPVEAAEQFLILDVETSRRFDLAVWWKPAGGGYTTSLDLAGRYSRTDADDRTRSTNGGHRAIPCDLVEGLAHRVVDMGDLRVAESLAAAGIDPHNLNTPATAKATE